MNYHNKKFRPISNSENGEVSEDMIFHYRQEGNILSFEYHGANIIKGHLIRLVNDDGVISIKYHQVNASGELMTGICNSTPEIQPNGKIKLFEKLQWTSGDKTNGNSVLEEV